MFSIATLGELRLNKNLYSEGEALGELRLNENSYSEFVEVRPSDAE